MPVSPTRVHLSQLFIQPFEVLAEFKAIAGLNQLCAQNLSTLRTLGEVQGATSSVYPYLAHASTSRSTANLFLGLQEFKALRFRLTPATS
jgi:hypothetical protein